MAAGLDFRSHLLAPDMVTTLRRIEPVSLAKIYAIVTGALMLVFALPAGCFMLVLGSAGGEFGAFGAGAALAMVIMYPVMGVVFGFIAGWLYGFVYNLVADRIGGVEIELDGYNEPSIL